MKSKKGTSYPGQWDVIGPASPFSLAVPDSGTSDPVPVTCFLQPSVCVPTCNSKVDCYLILPRSSCNSSPVDLCLSSATFTGRNRL
ncbi:MAG: hypothetical protein QXZ09_06640, partial [Candidatus Methanomethylicaceae archaeon]